ncbi:hypothetical protein ST27_10150 [Xanthomonas phaseoli pv. phaseoli]|uniref:hypothetical protein n=1 Tax=Xanthomonas phaseoli TaxID=1985254 RepID=UPI0005961022|nr:hypothetical protein [Xanthomonas phaseoli]KIJ00453.1 hypothetical protein ST27_10150 [Xanthomonas phaseoli pv. phaseoli]UZB30956.1 hypothetical protein OM951_11035 [Xanthomonas phaseoli pv. phaseoli]
MERVALETAAKAYLSELAADIAAQGDPNGDLSAEMQAAHKRRQAFASEMAQGRTDRAVRARRLLGVQIYGDALVRSEIERMADGDAHSFRERIWAGA